MVQPECHGVGLLDVGKTGEQLVEQLRPAAGIAAWVSLERNGEEQAMPFAQLRGVC